MSKADRILAKMRVNPQAWRIDDFKTVARAYEIKWRQRGTSHVVFVRQDGNTLPVPAHRPIKAIVTIQAASNLTGTCRTQMVRLSPGDTLFLEKCRSNY